MAVMMIAARDVEPGMRLEPRLRGLRPAPVVTVETWGPGAEEAPNRPQIWWTRIAFELPSGGCSATVYQPDALVPVVDAVPCNGCGTSVRVGAEAAVRMGTRDAAHNVGPLLDLCSECAEIAVPHRVTVSSA